MVWNEKLKKKEIETKKSKINYKDLPNIARIIGAGHGVFIHRSQIDFQDFRLDVNNWASSKNEKFIN